MLPLRIHTKIRVARSFTVSAFYLVGRCSVPFRKYSHLSSGGALVAMAVTAFMSVSIRILFLF